MPISRQVETLLAAPLHLRVSPGHSGPARPLSCAFISFPSLSSVFQALPGLAVTLMMPIQADELVVERYFTASVLFSFL